MNLLRINRMMLGVSNPVKAFCERVFAANLVDVERATDTAGADVLVVGRQQLNGGTRLAADVIPQCLAVHRVPLLVCPIPDVFDAGRYARDLVVWREACAAGTAVVVLEFGVLRELKNTVSEDELAERARTHQRTARSVLQPVLWLSGTVLAPSSSSSLS